MHHFHRHRERAIAHMKEGRFGHALRDHALQGRRRHGGPGRIFDQGDLRWVILKMISEKPSHGYELIRDIEQRLGGAYSPSPGVIYPTLTLLEDLGYIVASQSDGAKKAFSITPEGRTALEDNTPAVESIFQRIAAIAERLGGGPAPQIIRAMENLRLALRLKLEQGKLADADVTRITAVLDSAAREIEKD